eukprot:TRINITY_DN18340_c0_g1_i1.p1 TRINITY_DN18340_c0_g1~~TRINITY_DN18340_c0_g1_i1.p1  ORF type:complete len:833 (+),score=134.41 TRINITY_DN18340_c0_g1_i1:29-2527(+)
MSANEITQSPRSAPGCIAEEPMRKESKKEVESQDAGNKVCLSTDEYLETYHRRTSGVATASTPLSRSQSTLTDLEAFPGVVWQWAHRTGWRNYDQRVSVKIELSFRRGESKVRVQTGKGGSTPMELFFEDMIQHDPMSRNTRAIRREGPWSLKDRIRRFVRSWVRAFETGRPRREVFADYERRRQALNEKIDEREYDTSMYYKDRGVCAAIATSPLFFGISIACVVLNTMWLSIDADWNNADSLIDSALGFQIVEHSFCVFFTIELLIRFGAFERTCYACRDGWFSFDFGLVCIMVLEIWIWPLAMHLAGSKSEDTIRSFTALRLMRLLRLTRMARLLRAVPEILTLLRGITMAMRAVLTTMGVLLTVLFVFGIIFKSQCRGHAELEPQFKSVWHSMMTLMFTGILLDGPIILYNQIDTTLQRPMALLFLAFIFITAFTMLNMLIGVICEVVTQVSREETHKNEINYLKSHLLDILECYDVYQDNTIGRNEFHMLMMNLEMREALAKFGTDSDNLEELAEVLFAKSPEDRLSFKDVLNLVLRLKGGNAAQVTDIVDLREYVKQRADALDAHFSKVAGESVPTHSHGHKHIQRKPTHAAFSAPAVPQADTTLRVLIRSARGLRDADSFAFMGESDCFCQCVLLGKPHSMVKTKVCDDTLSPVWNEEFVMAQYTEGDYIKFMVMDQDYSGNESLGYVVLRADQYERDGFDGELLLLKAGHDIEAFLSLKVEVLGGKGAGSFPGMQSEPDLLNGARGGSPRGGQLACVQASPPPMIRPQPPVETVSQPSELGKITELLSELCREQRSLRAEVAELREELRSRDSCGRSKTEAVLS